MIYKCSDSVLAQAVQKQLMDLEVSSFKTKKLPQGTWNVETNVTTTQHDTIVGNCFGVEWDEN